MLKHGFSKRKNEHPLYIIWWGIKYRCNNKNCKQYKDYGGRGIIYDPRWNEFINFYYDMKFKYLYAIKQQKIKKPSIERKNVNGNYYKENCTFISKSEQGKNRRNNKYFKAISSDGKIYFSKNQMEFARQYDLNFSHINSILHNKRNQHKGWRFKYLDNKELFKIAV